MIARSSRRTPMLPISTAPIWDGKNANPMAENMVSTSSPPRVPPIERGLGYGAAVLELGLGFLQFFWDRNRMCAQDRLAETIVIDVRKQNAIKVSGMGPP